MLVDIKADPPRKKAFNINAIWLRPIHPIGEINRKGEHGSPYAARDYLGINPNLIKTKKGASYTDDELPALGKR